MKFKFGTINEMVCEDLDKILLNMLNANRAIRNDEMSDDEVIEYIKAVIKSAKISEHTGEDLFWGFDDPTNMNGESRVYYFYNPTYYVVIFMISAYMKMPAKLEQIEGFMDVFSRGLDGSTNRNFMGHGFDAMSDFRAIMKKFLEADTDIFVEKYPDISSRFTEQFIGATSFIRDVAEMHKGHEAGSDLEYKELNAYSYRKGALKWERCWINSEIDAGIRDAIVKLNQKGYFTTACCEGHTDKALYESTVSVYIYFDKFYDWPVEPPFFGVKNGIRCKKWKRGLYWDTRRRVKNESKEADRQVILNAINKWVDALPSMED